MWESIVDPRANNVTSIMPKFKLSDDEVKALTVFLKSRRGMNFTETSLDLYRARLSEPPPEVSAEPAPDALEREELISMGERLVGDRACLACTSSGMKTARSPPT